MDVQCTYIVRPVPAGRQQQKKVESFFSNVFQKLRWCRCERQKKFFLFSTVFPNTTAKRFFSTVFQKLRWCRCERQKKDIKKKISTVFPKTTEKLKKKFSSVFPKTADFLFSAIHNACYIGHQCPYTLKFNNKCSLRSGKGRQILVTSLQKSRQQNI